MIPGHRYSTYNPLVFFNCVGILNLFKSIVILSLNCITISEINSGHANRCESLTRKACHETATTRKACREKSATSNGKRCEVDRNRCNYLSNFPSINAVGELFSFFYFISINCDNRHNCWYEYIRTNGNH